MATRKQSGQVFTPHYLVCDILDVASYLGDVILHKHIIDNSCGDGAFLQEIVHRYCSAFLKQSTDLQQLSQELSLYVHGIELDPVAYQACLKNLDAIASQYQLESVVWDVRNTDALSVTDYNDRMDYVIGNPPYVRVHNLTNNYFNIKQFKFTQGGMTDLYLAFFEIGFSMLHKGGKLCYITPSSWINSVAGYKLREYIYTQHNLVKLIDLEHYQPFDAMAYTMIALLEKDVPHEEFTYCTYIGDKHIILDNESLRIEEAMIDGILYLADRRTLNNLRNIFMQKHKQLVQVKNGFATLADKVFIKNKFPFAEYIIPVIKASTGKWSKAFFPYTQQGIPLNKEKVFMVPAISAYLEENKSLLLKGQTEQTHPDWYLYGRTQALKDVCKDKYAINTIIIDIQSIKLAKVPSGAGVYSGLYILTEIDEQTLQDILFSADFIQYVRTLRHYKSGGYYTFSSKELEQYINYKLDNHENEAIARTHFSID